MGDEQAERCNILGPKPSSGSAPSIYVIILLTVLIVHSQVFSQFSFVKNQVTIFTDPHIYSYKRNDLPC